jgi:hypothetical protein
MILQYKAAVLGIALLAQATVNSGCGTYSQSDNNITSTEQTELKDAGRAIYEATVKKIQYNNEQHQIADYMLEMSKAGTIGYVVIYPPAMGQSVRHYKVKGKVLPCDAQLTPNQHQLWQSPGNTNSSYIDAPVVDQANDMGSYGGAAGNTKCVFFYTTDGVLVQTNNEYDYTSMPMADEPQPVQFKLTK